MKRKEIDALNGDYPGVDHASINALTHFCLENPELDRLNQMLAEFNLFEAVGMVWQENRHSNFLGFLLDPRQSHGLGSTFLEMFLQRVLKDIAPGRLGVSPLHFHLWDLSETVLDREWNFIDILIQNHEYRFVVAIENKVRIGEHSDQLRRYRELVRDAFPDPWKRIHILLSPDGRDAEGEEAREYLRLDYATIASLIQNLLAREGASLGQELSFAIRHYHNLLHKYLMTDNEINELCAEIYRKHKRAIDLITSKRSDRQLVVRSYFEQVLSGGHGNQLEELTTSNIKFFPLEWSQSIPVVGRTSSGSDLHLIYGMFINQKESLTFFVEMRTPQGSEFQHLAEIRQAIFKFAQDNKPFKVVRKEMKEQWTRIYRKEVLSPRHYQLPEDEFKRALYNAWNGILQTDIPAITEALKEFRPGPG